MQILKTKQTESTSEAETRRERDHLSAHFTLDLHVISASVLKGRTRDTNWLSRSVEYFARFLVTKQENTERRVEQNENKNDWKSCGEVDPVRCNDRLDFIFCMKTKWIFHRVKREFPQLSGEILTFSGSL